MESRHPYDQSSDYLAVLRRRLSKDSDHVEVDSVGIADNGMAITFKAHALFAGTVWFVTGDMAVNGTTGALVLVALSLTAVDPADTAITSRVITAVPRERLVARTLVRLPHDRAVDEWMTRLGKHPYPDKREQRRRASEIARTAPRRGRPSTSRAFFDQVAREAVQFAGTGRPVIASLAELYDRPESTVKRWLRQARSPEIGALDRRRNVWKLGPKYPEQTTTQKETE